MSVNKRIYLSPPHMCGEEIEYVFEAFRTNWIAPVGPHVDAFERELSAYFEQRVYAAAVHSGTAAIHLALLNLGIQPGDMVLVSTLTFAATVNPIVYERAVPVFIDSELQTWNMDTGLLDYAIQDFIRKGKKPRAILVVHIYGMPARMKEIMEIAQHYEIPVIEDAAEALGARIYQQHVGTFGVMAALSFNGNKIITTSGGGALLSPDMTYVENARFLATQARDNYPYYHHTHIGYNYRLSNVLAAIGRGQLKVLETRIKQKRQIFERYVDFFNKYEGISWTVEPEGFFSNRWLTTIMIEKERNDLTPASIIQALEEHNIEARHIWKPMHLQPVFAHYPSYVIGTAEHIFQRGVCLPSGTAMNEQDFERIFSVLHKVLHKH